MGVLEIFRIVHYFLKFYPGFKQVLILAVLFTKTTILIHVVYICFQFTKYLPYVLFYLLSFIRPLNWLVFPCDNLYHIFITFLTNQTYFLQASNVLSAPLCKCSSCNSAAVCLEWVLRMTKRNHQWLIIPSSNTNITEDNW